MYTHQTELESNRNEKDEVKLQHARGSNATHVTVCVMGVVNQAKYVPIFIPNSILSVRNDKQWQLITLLLKPNYDKNDS